MNVDANLIVAGVADPWRTRDVGMAMPRRRARAFFLSSLRHRDISME